MSANPTAACSVCGGTYQLRRDGKVRVHVREQPGGQWDRGTCRGSGQRPGLRPS